MPTSYLLGVSTQPVEKLVEQLGIRQLSKSQAPDEGTRARREDQRQDSLHAFCNRAILTGTAGPVPGARRDEHAHAADRSHAPRPRIATRVVLPRRPIMATTVGTAEFLAP